MSTFELLLKPRVIDQMENTENDFAMIYIIQSINVIENYLEVIKKNAVWLRVVMIYYF